MLLIYGNAETWDAMEKIGEEAVMAAHRVIWDETRARGEYIASEGLTTKGARIVQVVDGEATVTDGPFSEAKEVLAGYYLLECDLERATELAARLPEAPYSPIEVRAVTDPLEE
ncbi:hypothetical protein FB561_5401 [Kribbella amoyensis]|uniref:YCII-related domain-containing protein n=1 Tax=Kribbella amoyensis TaxID=996641 RepID=A0A561BZ77_9ACTN|nr:YciI family protein [Kribbella amoyensis]TWD84226.1 hypothetical protein FB561_5401 [Kribbella amoyensis]